MVENLMQDIMEEYSEKQHFKIWMSRDIGVRFQRVVIVKHARRCGSIKVNGISIMKFAINIKALVHGTSENAQT